jgi:hypothetical protein
MTGSNESPAPVAAGREANLDGAAKPFDTSGFPPDVNPGDENEKAEEMSWFNSVRDSQPSGSITVGEVWARFRTSEFAERVEAVRRVVRQMSDFKEGSDEWKELKELKDKLKRVLPAVIISGRVTFGGRSRAAEEGRFIHSGSIQIDLDAKDHAGMSVDEILAILKECPYIEHVTRSPSGEGVKAVCRVGRVETREGPDADPSLPTHKDAYACAEKYFATLGLKLDPACRDAGRLFYVTHDPEAWSRPEPATELPITKGADALRNKPAGESRLADPNSSPKSADSGSAKWALQGFVLSDLDSMLAVIGPQVKEDGSIGQHAENGDWIKIVNAAFDGFGTAAIPSLEKWRPCKKGELEKMALPKNRLNKVKFPTLIKFAQDCGWENPHKRAEGIEIPSDVFPVPGGEISISMAAECIFPMIASTNTLFMRGTTVHELVGLDGEKTMSPVGADRFCSVVEGYGKQVSRLKITDKDGEKDDGWIPATLASGSLAHASTTMTRERAV